MKSSFRLVIVATVLLSLGTLPAFAGVFGGDPPPPTQKSSSTSSTVVVDAVLNALGL